MTDLHQQEKNHSYTNSYLQNQLLIAMPNLTDPYFGQSVTLICKHNEEGCFGVTINKPIDITVEQILNGINQDAAKTDRNLVIKPTVSSVSNNTMPALRGGPVQTEQGYVIHDGNDDWENTLKISSELSLTSSRDILLAIKEGKGPDNYLLALGCASWEAGQIEDEILNNSWINCSVDTTVIFDMSYEKRWQGAADLLGVDMNAMSMVSGHD